MQQAETFDEVEHLELHVFQQQSDADGGEVTVGHFFISQYPLQEPLQMSLRRLQALSAPCQIGDVRGPLPAAQTHRNTLWSHAQKYVGTSFY